jgi:hypothetical protein
MSAQIRERQRLSSGASRPYWRIAMLTGVLAAFLIGTAIYSSQVWGELDDAPMSTNGYVALIIGGLAATAVGAGLMGLVFYSSRRGFDDDVG